MMQRKLNPINVLITGANGLIGRLVSSYLRDKGYTIYGLDRLPEGHVTPRFEMEKNENSDILKKKYAGEYFVADITKIDDLRKVMTAIGKVDIIIHLAAIIEKASPDIIQKVNEQGTENIFKICEEYNIKKILLASSMMVLWDKYTLESPYSLIKQNNFKGQSNDIKKITEKVVWSVSPVGEDISVAAYKNSKITSEYIAKKYTLKGISSISMRVGSVNTLNKPPKDHTWAWTHHEDLCNFVELAVAYLLNKNDKAESLPLFLCSHNKLCIVSLQKAKEVIGYVPKNGTYKNRLIQWRLGTQKSIIKDMEPTISNQPRRSKL